MGRLLGLVLLPGLLMPAFAATKIMVTVTDRKTSKPIIGLQAGDFSVSIDNAPRRIEDCEYVDSVNDIVLMVDSSTLGAEITRLAPSLIAQLGGKEQMSIVSYDSSAEMIQDFTSDKNTLQRVLSGVRFGNSPRLLDALFAVAADGFENSIYRRVILLLTTGVDGSSSVTWQEVVRICRRNGISIYAVHLMGYGRSQLEKMARLTGGAAFSARDLGKQTDRPAERIFEVMRGHYELTLSGNLPLGDEAKIEIAGQKKKRVFFSYLELN